MLMCYQSVCLEPHNNVDHNNGPQVKLLTTRGNLALLQAIKSLWTKGVRDLGQKWFR